MAVGDRIIMGAITWVQQGRANGPRFDHIDMDVVAAQGLMWRFNHVYTIVMPYRYSMEVYRRFVSNAIHCHGMKEL